MAPKEARIGRMVVEVRAARRSEDEKRDRGMAEARAAAGMMGKKGKRKRGWEFIKEDIKRVGTVREPNSGNRRRESFLVCARVVRSGHWCYGTMVLPAASAGCSGWFGVGCGGRRSDSGRCLGRVLSTSNLNNRGSSRVTVAATERKTDDATGEGEYGVSKCDVSPQ